MATCSLLFAVEEKTGRKYRMLQRGVGGGRANTIVCCCIILAFFIYSINVVKAGSQEGTGPICVCLEQCSHILHLNYKIYFSPSELCSKTILSNSTHFSHYFFSFSSMRSNYQKNLWALLVNKMKLVSTFCVFILWSLESTWVLGNLHIFSVFFLKGLNLLTFLVMEYLWPLIIIFIILLSLNYMKDSNRI